VRGNIAVNDEVVVFADRSGTIYAVEPDRSEASRNNPDDPYPS